MRFLRETEVEADLERALLGFSEEQRQWIGARYRDPEAPEEEVAATLGWTFRQTETVARSLRADRKHGKLLRQRLAAYKKKSPSPKIVVRDLPDWMPLDSMSIKSSASVVVQTRSGPMNIASTGDRRLVKAVVSRALTDARVRASQMGRHSFSRAAAEAEVKRLEETLNALSAEPEPSSEATESNGLVKACLRRIGKK